jgi:outer membrane protein OmpA-like peptidoglycan-associated protein
MPEKLPHGKKPGVADSDEKDADARSQTRWAQNRKVHFIQDADHSSPALVLQFDEASAQLTAKSLDQLNRLIPVLLGKQNRIEIRGHSTRRPLPGDSPYRDLWQLCFARSEETMKYLEQKGIEPDRLRLSQAGASEPVTNRIESAWQRENARVEVFLLTEMADDQPGVQKTGQTGAVVDHSDGKGTASGEKGPDKDRKAGTGVDKLLPANKEARPEVTTPVEAATPPAAETSSPAAADARPEVKEVAPEGKSAAPGG